ncbi:Pal1-domain-containing protein [Astrocystis sublimbata]|nr:Pal1-domain-containing protein [Astrocystis sublimbata]
MSAMEGDLLGLGQPPNQRATNAPPGLTLNLSSNNPFRNRAASPNSLGSPSLPRSPFEDPPPRPTSRNPFLDPAYSSSATQLVTSPEKMAQTQTKGAQSPTADELFSSLDIKDDNASKKPQPPRPHGGQRAHHGPPRGENVPPHGRGAPSSSHRPTRWQEEALRARKNGSKPISGSPHRRPEPRLRRNSESSIMEKPTDEEKKLREMRHRDRERRHRDGKGRPKKLDLIDQLDATSIYGTGLFHHDGPFDACNPSRNRKGSRRAPMQAFAKDSANNTIGGAGPLNKRPDHKVFMGNDMHDPSGPMYAGRDPHKPKAHEMELFDPKQRFEFEYGEETLGLGSSTFLEGTPAARTAIARNQEETAQQAVENGLGRKKSVVSRFKSIKRGQSNYEGRVTSPGAYQGHSPRPSLPSAGITGERNPFFAEYDKADERITVQRKDSNVGTPSTPPVHGGSLERRSTTDATMDGPAEGQTKQAGGGFLSRVKSLKGGPRRQRPEPPVKDATPDIPRAAV